MANGEQRLTLTSGTTTGTMYFAGPSEISVQGTFSTGTLTHYTTNSVGRGAAARTATTIAEVYESHVLRSEFEVTGADGSTSIEIVGRAIAVINRG